MITLQRLQPVKMMITQQDLSKQQKLDADRKAIQQINFTGNLDWAEFSTMLFIIEDAKQIVSDFSKGTVRVLWFYFRFSIILI